MVYVSDFYYCFVKLNLTDNVRLISKKSTYQPVKI